MRRKIASRLARLEIQSLARPHTRKILNVLMGIVRQEDCSPAARVAAAKAILDRGWGQPMAHPDSQPAAQITQIIREIVHVHKSAGLPIIPDRGQGAERRPLVSWSPTPRSCVPPTNR
jgi:hypothetical protein